MTPGAYTILVLLRPGSTSSGDPLPGWHFLMVQNARRGGRWELPGGRCHPGEVGAACAARECEEETGHRLEDARLVLERDGPLGHGYVFVGRLGAPAGTPDPAEIAGMEFVARLPPRDQLSFPRDPYEATFEGIRRTVSPSTARGPPVPDGP